MPPRIRHATLSQEQLAASVLGTPAPARRAVKHLSYSGRTAHEECPKAYELKYLSGVPRKGAVWFLGGKAVHRATEAWDRAQVAGEKIDIREVWDHVFREELKSSREDDPEEGQWRRAGITAEDSEGESIGRWYAQIGPLQVENYVAWRKRNALWRIWTTPTGEPAIELDVSGTLPGMPVPVKGFIDRIFADRTTTERALVDLKTGSRKPASGLQLGIYAALTAERYGVTIPTGAAFMTRPASLAPPWALGKFTPEYVGRHFGQLYAAIQAGYFVPRVGSQCGRCDVSAACYAVDGPLSHLYDPDDPGYTPPF